MKIFENLIKAYIGESQARNRYTFYASIARKEGYEQIAEIFEITAMNEKEHAETFFELAQKLKGNLDEIKIEASAPLSIGNTIDNLKAAIKGEHYENSELYPEFAKIAREEGFNDIASRIEAIIIAEKHHEERYKKLLELLESGKFFKRDEPIVWVCRKCGYVHIGKTPPQECPSCGHSFMYFQRLCEEY
ncbi:MAG: rubrerythrin family protein [Candidatus Verstraetearchaeota archaeon]|nr:rubrerythrin family protein [Candidatus Verstraetearchaeota archaeon]